MEGGKGKGPNDKGKDPNDKGKTGKDPNDKGKTGKGEMGTGEASCSADPNGSEASSASRSRSPRRPPACRGCRFLQEAMAWSPGCVVCEELLDYIADLRSARRNGLTREEWETQILILQDARRRLPNRDWVTQIATLQAYSDGRFV